MSNTSSTPNDPSDPLSSLSRTARLACWLTGGGTRRSPTTATSFFRMAQERAQLKKAQKAWKDRKRAALEEHTRQWGQSGPGGNLEDSLGIGVRPKWMELIRWWREIESEGGGGAGGGGRTTQPPARHQQPERREQPGDDGDGGHGIGEHEGGNGSGGNVEDGDDPTPRQRQDDNAGEGPSGT